MNIGEDKTNLTGEGASSFGEGSFMSYEAPTESISSDSRDGTAGAADAPDTKEGYATESLTEANIEAIAEGASSFDTESFATYEARQSTTASGGISGNGGIGSNGGNGGNGGSGGIGTAKQPAGKLLGTLGWILFFASFPASFISLIVMIVSVIIGGGAGALAIGSLLAVPVASIVVGILLKRKSGEGTKNIVIGIIAASFIGLMLGSSFGEIDINMGIEDEDESVSEFVASVEAKLQLDIPEYDYSYGYSNTSEDNEDYIIFYDLEYYDSASYEQVIQLCRGKYFTDRLPNTYIGMLPRAERSIDFDYCMIYNVTTGEYNKLPTASGTYRMICVTFYDWGDGTGYLTVTECNLEYINQFASNI